MLISLSFFFFSGIVSLTFALPGSLIVLSLIIFFAFISKIIGVSIVFGSVAILIYAYVMRYMAVGMSPLRSSFDKHPDSVADTGENLGLSNFHIFQQLPYYHLIVVIEVKLLLDILL